MEDEEKQELKSKKKVDSKIQKKESNVNVDNKKKKIITFSVIGGIALVIILIVAILLIGGKPSKKNAKEIVELYLEAVNNYDGEKFLDLLDSSGYIIYHDGGEDEFNKKYNNKNDNIKEYLDRNFYDNLKDAEEEISNSFRRTYKYDLYEYELAEISYIGKSKKSNKLAIIKAKVNIKSVSSNDTKELVIYTTKVDGKYKIVSAEFV